MRVRLKGINRATKRLADGTRKTYWYAWRNGPLLKGEPESPEFVASYNEVVAKKHRPPEGVLSSILRHYTKSEDFLSGIAERTRKDYLIKIRIIEKEFGEFPLAALSDKRSRGIFKAWRDRLAKTSRRQADYAFVVLARVLAWGKDRGLVDANPCERGGRLYRGSRAEIIWTNEDIATFVRHAPSHLVLPLMLGLWTGQREGDLLRLPWSGYDGRYIRLRQSKTGARVVIPVGAPLKTLLDATPKQSTVILVNSEGKPWSPDGFRSSFFKMRDKAGIRGVTFGDLRGTAVTRLAPKPRLRRSPVTASGMSEASSTPTICPGIRLSGRMPSPSWRSGRTAVCNLPLSY
jgi:integrase